MSSAAKSDPEIGVEALPAAEPHPRRMLDRYEIIAQIAKGGMGTVYLARREGAGGFERLSAIKILHEHLAEDDTFVTMLLDEARTAAHIHHPNAIGIDDVAESPVGHYLVMAYVDGYNLAQIMTEPALGESDRIRICARLIVDAAQGLHAAHTAKNAKGERLGIVHRDVSPQNVLVGTDGMGRIVDFGIALAASRIAASRPGTLKGKPQYMAPEQARGEPCDARTDVFALGVVLWEALTLERLFYGEMDVAILVQVMDCVVPDPRDRNPNAPPALADVAMKALSRRQEDRYATAREMATALERAGGLASTAEVEDTLARVFEAENTLKAEAVRRHLASSTGAVEPLQKGQLGLVPRLLPKKLAAKRVELATRASGRNEVPSGVRARSGEMDLPLAPTAAIESSLPVTSISKPRIDPPARAPGRTGIVVAAIGLFVLVAVAAFWASGRTPPTTALAPPSIVAPPPSVAPEATVVAPPTTIAAPSIVAVPVTDEHEAPQDDVHEHGHHHVRSTPPASTTTTTPAPESSITIETNPYLSH